MEAFKGSRGPWRVDGESQTIKHNFKIVGTHLGSKHKIARVPFMGIDEGITTDIYEKLKEEALADAHLIAAAPDLLYAVQILIGDIERAPDKLSKEEKLNITRNAINKALNIQS